MTKKIVRTQNSTYVFVDGVCSEARTHEGVDQAGALGLPLIGFYDLTGSGVHAEATEKCLALIGPGAASRVVLTRTITETAPLSP